MSSDQLETDDWSPRIRALYDHWRMIHPSPGRRFHEVHPDFAPASPDLRRLWAAGEQGAVLWRRGRPIFALHVDRCAAVDRIILPLAEDGASVDMGLAMTVHCRSNGSEI